MRSLVIDDEYAALQGMAAILGSLGRCDPATNGQQALELFCKALDGISPYHLVTIDINMPDTNGIRLLGCLQQEERVRGVAHARKIMITAASTTSNVLAALTGECDGFLAKPVRRAVLLEKLVALELLPAGMARLIAGRARLDR